MLNSSKLVQFRKENMYLIHVFLHKIIPLLHLPLPTYNESKE